MTKSQELIRDNFIQKIATGRMVVSFGEYLSYGKEDIDLLHRIKIVRQLQGLFDVESKKEDFDLKLLTRVVLQINSLLNEYQIVGQIEIRESIILPVNTKKLSTIIIEGGNASINDSNIAPDTTWSSLKISQYLGSNLPEVTFEYIIPSANGVLNV